MLVSVLVSMAARETTQPTACEAGLAFLAWRNERKGWISIVFAAVGSWGVRLGRLFVEMLCD